MTVLFLFEGGGKCFDIYAKNGFCDRNNIVDFFKTICFISVREVSLYNSTSKGMLLHALFESAVLKVVHLIQVRAASTRSIGEFHFVSSIMLFIRLASSTNLIVFLC